jgi:hypothetical protein
MAGSDGAAQVSSPFWVPVVTAAALAVWAGALVTLDAGAGVGLALEVGFALELGLGVELGDGLGAGQDGGTQYEELGTAAGRTTAAVWVHWAGALLAWRTLASICMIRLGSVP